MTLGELYMQWARIPAIHSQWLDGWEMHPHLRDGEVVAIAALRGTEIHFAVKPEWRNRVILRDITRAFLAPLMERRGYLTTRTRPYAYERRFLERLGFKHTWSNDGVDHYMLTELPFGREN
jgi:hypothetical protein